MRFFVWDKDNNHLRLIAVIILLIFLIIIGRSFLPDKKISYPILENDSKYPDMVYFYDPTSLMHPDNMKFTEIYIAVWKNGRVIWSDVNDTDEIVYYEYYYSEREINNFFLKYEKLIDWSNNEKGLFTFDRGVNVIIVNTGSRIFHIRTSGETTPEEAKSGKGLIEKYVSFFEQWHELKQELLNIIPKEKGVLINGKFAIKEYWF
ncbi:MAG: hypothetical protein LBQ54_15965 [Planctomycetaceae bacterium]|nr:hypothetical protein [Planctomycetaceae bacterium]